MCILLMEFQKRVVNNIKADLYRKTFSLVVGVGNALPNAKGGDSVVIGPDCIGEHDFEQPAQVFVVGSSSVQIFKPVI